MENLPLLDFISLLAFFLLIITAMALVTFEGVRLHGEVSALFYYVRLNMICCAICNRAVKTKIKDPIQYVEIIEMNLKQNCTKPLQRHKEVQVPTAGLVFPVVLSLPNH